MNRNNQESLVIQISGVRTHLAQLGGQIEQLREQIEKNGVRWVDTWTHRDVAPHVAIYNTLRADLARLGAEMIRLNLATIGLSDMAITAKIPIFTKSGAELRAVQIGEGHLTDFCYPAGLRPKVKYDEEKEDAGFVLQIYSCNTMMGYVDSDGRFHYTQAPDLRSCVGWAVATDWGSHAPLDYDLDFEVNKLEYAIRTAPPVDGTAEEGLKKHFFSGRWKRAVREVMAHEHGSAFGDGYCGFTSMFWRLATRTLRGVEHPAFEFFY